MGVTSGPRIESDGLIYCFDPANPRSFSGGSSFKNISKKGRGNSGSFGGNPTFKKGRGRGRFSLDGEDDSMSVPDSDELSGLSAFTIAAWVKPTNNRNFWILSKGIGATGNREFGLYLNSNGHAEVVIADESADTEKSTISRREVPANEWHYVVAIWSGSYLEILIDGAPSGPKFETSIQIENLSSPMYIGRSAGSDYASGEIGTIHIYDKVLTYGEIKTNYLNGKSRFEQVGRYVTPNDKDKFVFDCLTDSSIGYPHILLDLYQGYLDNNDVMIGPFEFVVDWGDGTSERVSLPLGYRNSRSFYYYGYNPETHVYHEYENSGIYTITIDGQMNNYSLGRTTYYNSRRGTLPVLGYRSWGQVEPTEVFENINLNSLLTGIPELQSHGPVDFFIPEEALPLYSGYRFFSGYSGIFPTGLTNSKFNDYRFMFTATYFENESESANFFQNLDTSGITDFHYMFGNSYVSSGITDFEIPSGSNLTQMFYNHRSPDKVDWSSLRIPSGCVTQNMIINITDSGILNIDTSNVEDFRGWLGTIDVNVSGYWDFSNARDLSQLTGSNYSHDLSKQLNITPGKVKDISRLLQYNSTYSHNVDFLVTSGVENMSWFCFNSPNVSRNLDNWDTSTVKDMSYLFYYQNPDHQISGSMANLIGPSVENVNYLFYLCSNTGLSQDFSNWDMSSVKTANAMFYNSNSSILNSSNQSSITGWDVSSLVSGQSMFGNCSDFNADLSNWNLSSIENLQSMFVNCSSFDQDLSSWNLSGVEIGGIFGGSCGMSADNINKIDISHATRNSTWLPSSYNGLPPTGWFKGDCSWFFYNTSFNQNISSYDFSEVTSMRYMFATSPFNQNVSNWDVSNVTDMSALFSNNTAFNQSLANWDTSSVTGMAYFFQNSAYSQWSSMSGWDTSNVQSMFYAFAGGNSLTNINLPNFITSGVGTLFGMFNGIRWDNHPRFTNGGSWLSTWDVSTVTDMTSMFRNHWYNSNLGISNWDVGRVRSMSNMFVNSQHNVDISNWDTSSCQNMSSMFYWNWNFNRDISSWDVSKVTNFSQMFYGTRVFDQDLSDWDFSGIGTVEYANTGALYRFKARYTGWGGQNYGTTNYSNLLNKWYLHASSGQIPQGMSNVEVYGYYNSGASSARNSLVNDYGWTIIDRGQA